MKRSDSSRTGGRRRRNIASATATATTAATAATVQARVSRRVRRTEAIDAAPAADPSAIHFSSLPTSAADCQRSSRSFARHVFTTRSSAGGVIGATAEIADGSEDMIDEISEAWLAPENAFLPVAIS